MAAARRPAAARARSPAGRRSSRAARSRRGSRGAGPTSWACSYGCGGLRQPGARCPVFCRASRAARAEIEQRSTRLSLFWSAVCWGLSRALQIVCAATFLRFYIYYICWLEAGALGDYLQDAVNPLASCKTLENAGVFARIGSIPTHVSGVVAYRSRSRCRPRGQKEHRNAATTLATEAPNAIAATTSKRIDPLLDLKGTRPPPPRRSPRSGTLCQLKAP